MTDAHCHVSGGDPSVREFLIGRDFVGVHPWDVRSEVGGQRSEVGGQGAAVEVGLRRRLRDNPQLGVGEIGLDRLKEKNISPEMREVFEAQLKVALEFRRPVVLHGAKCWGQVVEAVRRVSRPAPGTMHQAQGASFLFHGFSRSDGLIPDIVALNGYVSVGPAVLNDHAVNYRELVKKIPLDRLLVETDRTEENAAAYPSVRDVAAKVAALRNLSPDELERLTDENADAFRSGRGA